MTDRPRVGEASKSRVSFSPVQRVKLLEGGGLSELVDLQINLHNDKLRHDFDGMKIGDEQEFTLDITVVAGYRRVGDEARASAEVA